MNQTFLKHKSYSLAWTSESTRLLFPVERTNNIKIRTTHCRGIRDECIWEGISLMNTNESVSQSVLHQVLNEDSDGVFKGNV